MKSEPLLKLRVLVSGIKRKPGELNTILACDSGRQVCIDAHMARKSLGAFIANSEIQR